MVLKLLKPINNDETELISIDLKKDPQIFLDRFPGSILVDSEELIDEPSVLKIENGKMAVNQSKKEALLKKRKGTQDLERKNELKNLFIDLLMNDAPQSELDALKREYQALK